MMDFLHTLWRPNVVIPFLILFSITSALYKNVRILYFLTNPQGFGIDDEFEDVKYSSSIDGITSYNDGITNYNNELMENERNVHHPQQQLVTHGGRTNDHISQMIDFGILGFAKCGTSTMRQYLNTNELWVAPKEQCFLWDNDTIPELMSLIETNASSMGAHVKRGIKCPMALQVQDHRHNWHVYLSSAKIIVGIRHPLRWFESYYNFRVQQGHVLPPAIECLKYNTIKPPRKCGNLHPFRARFHYYLAMLGKTPLTDEEISLVLTDNQYWSSIFSVSPVTGKIFVYILDQLDDADELRSATFRNDLRQFLGVREELPQMIHKQPGKEWPRVRQEKIDKMKIDICDDKFREHRGILMRHAVETSIWLRNYFLYSEDVVVSSRDYFEELLRGWEHDPCTS